MFRKAGKSRIRSTSECRNSPWELPEEKEEKAWKKTCREALRSTATAWLGHTSTVPRWKARAAIVLCDEHVQNRRNWGVTAGCTDSCRPGSCANSAAVSTRQKFFCQRRPLEAQHASRRHSRQHRPPTHRPSLPVKGTANTRPAPTHGSRPPMTAVPDTRSPICSPSTSPQALLPGQPPAATNRSLSKVHGRRFHVMPPPKARCRTILSCVQKSVLLRVGSEVWRWSGLKEAGKDTAIGPPTGVPRLAPSSSRCPMTLRSGCLSDHRRKTRRPGTSPPEQWAPRPHRK